MIGSPGFSCVRLSHHRDADATGPLGCDPRLHLADDTPCVPYGAPARPVAQRRAPYVSPRYGLRGHWDSENRDGWWLRCLSAWVEGQYPPGTIGRSAAMKVLREVRRLAREELRRRA